MKIFVLQVIFLIIFNISFGQSHILVPEHAVDSYFTAEEICLRQYSSRIDSITQEVKADSLSCLRTADIRFQSNEKFEILQEPMRKCSSPETGIKDYFNCIENIVPEIQIKFKEITSAYQVFLQNVDKIEQNKTACLNEASSKGNDESTNAAFNLNSCLQNIRQQQINSTKEQILVEKNSSEEQSLVEMTSSEEQTVVEMNSSEEQKIVDNPPLSEDLKEFLSYLDVVKEMYNQLKSCTLDYNNNYQDCFNDAKIFHLRAGEQGMNDYLKDHLPNNSSEYFSKITEIDEADDSCLRQFIVQNLNSDFEFDLQTCLMYGSRTTLEYEVNVEIDKELIEGLQIKYNRFSECRDITKNLDIHNCVHFQFRSLWMERKVQEAISMKSETNFKNFKETLLSSYTKQYPCMENLCDFLQFYGFNLRPMEKNILLSCFEKGYKPTVPLPFDKQLIKDLSEIQEFLKTCTAHPKSPGYNRCFINMITVYDTTRKYLQDKNSNYSEIVAEHDKNHDTCFEYIVKGITSNDLLLSRKCLFP